MVIGGGITGDMQPNDTALHHNFKIVYREKEQQLLTTKLRENPDKVPSLTRNEIMVLTAESWDDCDVDQEMAFKANWLTNSLDGREDHLVSSRIRDLVGEEFTAFREELLSSEPANNMRELIASITPPEGVRRSDHGQPRDLSYISEDESAELLDGDGSDLEPEVSSKNTYYC